jgi:hypothetical protein
MHQLRGGRPIHKENSTTQKMSTPDSVTTSRHLLKCHSNASKHRWELNRRRKFTTFLQRNLRPTASRSSVINYTYDRQFLWNKVRFSGWKKVIVYDIAVTMDYVLQDLTLMRVQKAIKDTNGAKIGLRIESGLFPWSEFWTKAIDKRAQFYVVTTVKKTSTCVICNTPKRVWKVIFIPSSPHREDD